MGNFDLKTIKIRHMFCFCSQFLFYTLRELMWLFLHVHSFRYFTRVKKSYLVYLWVYLAWWINRSEESHLKWQSHVLEKMNGLYHTPAVQQSFIAFKHCLPLWSSFSFKTLTIVSFHFLVTCKIAALVNIVCILHKIK